VSILLLTILAVMWVAFLLPLIAPRERGRPGWPRRGAARADGEGWRPAGGSGQRTSVRSGDTRRRLARRRAVLRRRRVLLALTIAMAAAVRVWFLLGGRWWIAAAVTSALLLAYLGALVGRGWRRRARATAATAARPVRRGRWPARRRRRTDLPLWGAPVLEGQAPARPE
jgi:hypothetical protein